MLNYVEHLGTRCKEELLGIAMIGNEVCLVRKGKGNEEDSHEPEGLFNGEWISMFRPEFVRELDRIKIVSIGT